MKTVSKTKLKEQRINAYLSGFDIKFDITDSAIDLRTMSENYPDKIIPSADVTKAVNAVLGEPAVPANSIDPRGGKITPKFDWVPNTATALYPVFQRDIIPSHVVKIELDFDGFKIIVPCAVKHPITGLYLLWDGNHTRQVCERQGWSHIPIWYIDIELIDGESEQDMIKRMIKLAGEAFLSINKKNKREVARYDEHKIRVETYEPVAVTIQYIVDSNNCFIARASDEPGAITHIAHLYDAYELTQTTTGTKGMYLARALQFHTATWPKEKVDSIMMLALARLFHLTDLKTKVLLPPAFDKEFGDILRETYGFSSAVQSMLKDQYIAHFGSMAGHPEVVTSGLVLTYNKHGSGKFKLTQPESNYPVK